MNEPHFRVGQRVICIDASLNPLSTVMPLVRGRIYVVRAVDRGKIPGWGVSRRLSITSPALQIHIDDDAWWVQSLLSVCPDHFVVL
jgi:hypothetical protein